MGMKSPSGTILRTIGIEVGRREPGIEGGAHRGPVVVGDRKPRRVAVSAIDDLMVAEDALEAKAKAFGGATRCGVESVALPLQAAVAQVIEGVAGEQVDRFGGRGGALQLRSEPDVADLDRAEGGLDPQVGSLAQGALCRKPFQTVGSPAGRCETA